MPHRRYEWLQRIKDVEREHSVARLAVDRLLEAADLDPGVLTTELRLRDIRRAAERLDGTYVIRLFAEFETGLRLFWPTARGSDPPSRTRDLLDGVAATRRIPHDQLAGAHAVREFRNHLVHERDDIEEPLSISDARHNLCTYFGRLPLEW